jgi:diguanylate cyclase (GGDEF)-like protein/PAS domain S-box-containing protein
MFKYYTLTRAVCYVTSLPLLAEGIESLKHGGFSGLSTWLSPIAASAFCASVVLLLSFRLLCRARAQREKFLHDIIENLPEIACIIGDGGKFKHWNSNLETALGYTSEELAKITAFDTIAEEERTSGRETIAKVLADGMAKVESVLVSKSGIRIPCLLTGVRVVVNDAFHVLGIAVDLRKLRQAEESLRASEEQYRSLVANIPEVVWKADWEGNVSFVGRQVETMLGYSTAEVYQQGDSLWYKSIHAEDRQRVRQAFELLIKEGIPYDIECRVQRKNGEWLWAHDRASVTCDKDGTRVAAGLLSDITERKTAEETLQKLASIVQSSQDAIIGKDTNGVITTWNRAAENLYGYTTAEAIGQDLRFLLPPEKRSEMGAIMERVNKGLPIECLETQRLTKGGSIVDVSLSVSAIRDATGRVTGASTIARDITLRKHSEEQLNLQSAALEAAANAIVITDYEGTIVWANRAFTIMTGYSKEEVLGKNPRMFKSAEQSEGYYANLWSTISSGRVWQGEIVNRRKDGTTYIEEMTITPVTRDVSNPANRYFVAVKQDVTARKRSEEMLQNSENKYRVLFEDSADANWLMDEKGFLDCNSAALEMFGYSAESPMLHPADISPPNQLDGTPSRIAADRKIVAALLNGKERFEWLHQRKNGSVFPADVCLTALTLSGRPTLLATVRDITDRKEVEEALLFKTALLEAQSETTIDGILAVDDSDHIVLANKQFGLHFGISDEMLSTQNDQLVRKHLADRVADPDAFVERINYLYDHWDEKSRDEIKFKNGKVFDRYSAPLVDSRKQYRGRIWYFRDITDRKLVEERVQYLAYYDALTGLPNRTLLQDRLARTLASARRQKDKVALLFLDLDGFKKVNDSLGHRIGDLLLQEIADRLKKWGREQDTVARLGGDEFLIMLTGIKDVPDVAVAAERLMDAMTAAFVVQGHSLSIGCCIGISIFPEHGGDGETLISRADAAMYSAKEYGRNNFRFFTEEMNTQVLERLTLENSLRSALENQELFLMYQPQMDIVTGKITGLEALLRWQHRGLGLVPPDKFIRIAENSGLIVPIGEWVLRTACAQSQRWQAEGLPAVRVAVNVSAIQFRQEGFCEVVRRALHETGLAPQYLELELTESLLLANADVMLSVVQELTAMGVTLAIDDFGTGYSSFAYLRQFQVSKLKIDRSFIRDVAVNPDDAAITAAVISMAKSLRLKVIAEGVENEAQMSFLRAHQCDEIQGYYFSKPLAVDKVGDKLRGNSPEPRKLVGDNRDSTLYEVGISLMSIGFALLVSADSATIQQFSLALRDLSISPDVCQDAASAGLLLKGRKFEAVIVDLQLGGQSGQILDEVRLSLSNRTAVTFGISDSDNDAEATAAFRKKSQFVFERPLSAQSIHKTLKPAYGLILRERRRYFRYPVTIPVIIQRESGEEVRCSSVNISGGGMALGTQIPLLPGEGVRVQFTLPDHEAQFVAKSTICWSKAGHFGVRFVSVSDEDKSQLQTWLSEKLEETLPEFVAKQFRKAELCSN